MQAGSKENISRRNLIKAAAGLGAGAAVGLPAMGFLARSDAGGARASGDRQGSATARPNTADIRSDQPLVAYVRDAATGEVVVMFGANETVVRDPQLVARLMGAAQG